ncbi:MAG: hypothetical protein AAGI13_02955 [Pseudomonadota bacterium]
MSRQETIITEKATAIPNRVTYAEQVKDLEAAHANLRRELVAMLKAIPFRAVVTRFTMAGMLFLSAAVVLAAAWASIFG